MTRFFLVIVAVGVFGSFGMRAEALPELVVPSECGDLHTGLDYPFELIDVACDGDWALVEWLDVEFQNVEFALFLRRGDASNSFDLLQRIQSYEIEGGTVVAAIVREGVPLDTAQLLYQSVGENEAVVTTPTIVNDAGASVDLAVNTVAAGLPSGFGEQMVIPIPIDVDIGYFRLLPPSRGHEFVLVDATDDQWVAINATTGEAGSAGQVVGEDPTVTLVGDWVVETLDSQNGPSIVRSARTGETALTVADDSLLAVGAIGDYIVTHGGFVDVRTGVTIHGADSELFVAAGAEVAVAVDEDAHVYRGRSVPDMTLRWEVPTARPNIRASVTAPPGFVENEMTLVDADTGEGVLDLAADPTATGVVLSDCPAGELEARGMMPHRWAAVWRCGEDLSLLLVAEDGRTVIASTPLRGGYEEVESVWYAGPSQLVLLAESGDEEIVVVELI